MTADEDTALHNHEVSGFDAIVGDRWDSVQETPNGGYLVSIAARALARAVPHPDPVTISGLLIRPARHGPASVRVRPLKAGRTLSYAAGDLVQDGQEIVHAHAGFSDLTTGGADSEPVLKVNRRPELPAPEECVDLFEHQAASAFFPGVTMADRLEYRVPRRPGWSVGRPSGDPTAALWVRLRPDEAEDPIDAFTMPLMVDAMAPALLELGFHSTTVSLTVHIRRRPSRGWMAYRAITRTVGNGWHEEDVDVWDSTGALVAQSRQLARVATAVAEVA